MPLELYTAKLAERFDVSSKFIWLHFELIEPHRLEFQAGQYVLLDIPGTDQKKQYSIASEPQNNHGIELLVDITPGGPGSTYLSKLIPGDTVTFRAPLGIFVVPPDCHESEKVFLATGSGITPLRSMILDQLHTRGDTTPIKLYWGLRHAEDMFWEEDFYSLDQDYQNFHFETILSKPPANWHLSTGYVTDLLEAYQKDYNQAGFYVCGRNSVVESLTQFLLDKKVNPINIHTEKFN